MVDMQALLNAFLDMLMSVFPTSPFAGPIEELAQLPYLGYLNWFGVADAENRYCMAGGNWTLLFVFYHCAMDQADPITARGNYYDIFVLRYSRIRQECTRC